MPKRYSNKLKENSKPEKEEEEIVVEKEKEKKSSPPGPFMQKLRDRLEKYKIAQLSGLFLILFSICLLLAFTSFLFTWQVDYDKVTGPITSILSPSVKTANWLGNFGALLSNIFINHWFGIAAYGFVLLSFITGVKLLLNITLLPFAKTIRVTLFLMVWTCLMMGYIFHQNHLFMGGGIGYFSAEWLDGMIGRVGTLLSLSFIGIAFLLINNLVKVPSFKKAATVPVAEKVEEEESAEDERHDIEEPVLKVERTKNVVKEGVPPPPTAIEFNGEPVKPPVEEKKNSRA